MVSYLLPNHLKYWINSIPKPSCALLNKLDDLSSNKTLYDIATYSINGKVIPYADQCQSYDAMVRCILSYLGEQYGWNNLPPTLKHTTACDMIARGQPEESLCLLELLYRISTNQPIESTPSPTKLLSKQKNMKKKEKLLEFVLENTPKKTVEIPKKENSNKVRHIHFNENPINPRKDEKEENGVIRNHHNHNHNNNMKSSSIEQVSQIVPQKLKKNEIPSQVVNQQVNHMVTQSLTEKSKSDFLKTDQQAHENSELSISHQKQLRSRITQRSNSPPQLDSHDQMYLTKNINDIDLVFGEPPINQPMDNTIPSTQRMKILRWLSTLGLCPRPPAYDPCSGQAYQNANQELDLEDDWNNGVLLSQLAAICSHGNRNEVKEVTTKSIVKVQESKVSDLLSHQHMFGHKRCLIQNEIGTKVDNKPILMLVGTENIVKSKAQAIRNMQIALKSLSYHTGLEDLEFILPQDLVYGRRSLWPVLNEVYQISPSLITHTSTHRTRSRSVTRSQSRSHSENRKRSQSPNSKTNEELQTKERGRSPRRRGNTEQNRSKSVSPSKPEVSRPPTPKKSQVSMKSRSISPDKSSPLKRVDDPGQRARKSIRSASPAVKSSQSQVPKTEQIHHPIKVQIKKSKNLKISKPTSTTTKSQIELENGWNSSWSQRDRDTIWDLDPDLRFHGRLEDQPQQPQQVKPQQIKSSSITHSKMKISKNLIRQQPTWYPPTLSSYDQDVMSKELDCLAHITPQQQHVIKDWLYSLGFSIHPYEGGYIDHNTTPFLSTAIGNSTSTNSATTSNPPILELKEDRLRNGVLLCDLLHLLEPNASKHSQLQQLIYRKPISLPQVINNLERVLWLLRIRKCPPIPIIYLTHPKLIMEGNRNIIWGLLYEMMKAYPSSLPSSSSSSSSSNHLSTQTSIPINSQLSLLKNQSHATLPYTLQDRKLLDQSLVYWLIQEGILSNIMEGLYSSPSPHTTTSTTGATTSPSIQHYHHQLPSIITLEGPIRDGTLLCLLINKILPNNPITSRGGGGYHKFSKTYATSMQNVQKCINILKLNPLMSKRFLYPGIEHDIVKGEWSAILGLLEDIHRLRDGIPPNKPPIKSHDGRISKPYLGEFEYQWPPPLQSNEDYRVFTVEDTHLHESSNPDTAGTTLTTATTAPLATKHHQVNLKNNAPIHHILYPEKSKKSLKKKINPRGRSLSPPPPPPPPPPLDVDEEDEGSSSPGDGDEDQDIIPGKKFNPIRQMRLDYLSNQRSNVPSSSTTLAPAPTTPLSSRRRGNLHENDNSDEDGGHRDGNRSDKSEKIKEREIYSSSDYQPPNWSASYQPKNDILPVSITGGIDEWKRSQQDLHPQKIQNYLINSQIKSKNNEDEDEDNSDDVDDISDRAIRGSNSGNSENHEIKRLPSQQINPDSMIQFHYRGPPKSSLLRVQAMNSRLLQENYHENPSIPRVPETGADFQHHEQEYSSPTSSTNLDNIEEENQDQNSWNKQVKAFYKGHNPSKEHLLNSPPTWFHELQSNQKNMTKNSLIQNQQYDENYSITSTPPQQSKQQQQERYSSSTGGGMRQPLIATSGLLDSNRFKSALKVFRWLTKLNLLPPSIPPLEIPKRSASPSTRTSTGTSMSTGLPEEFYLPSFHDGVILGKLIQKLERIGPLNGFTEYPKTRAQKLQNIRKVLQHLSQNKKIPLSSLAIEEEILEGNSIAIIDLLLMIKEVYKTKYVQ